MKKPLVIGLLLAAIIGVASYVAAGPYLAIHGIRTALAEQDSGRLQKHVDFPALRVNLRVFQRYVVGDAYRNPAVADDGRVGVGAGSQRKRYYVVVAAPGQFGLLFAACRAQ